MIEHGDQMHTAEADGEATGLSDWENWWRSDRLDAIGWAVLFLWGALVVLAEYTSFSDDFDWWDGWGVFLVGAGAIVLVEALFRLWTPEYRSKLGWTLFWGTVFLSLGLGGLVSRAWHALPLVVIAVAILKDAFATSR
jgi:hypothetical protein